MLFPSAATLKASFDPNGARRTTDSYFIRSSDGKSLTQAAEKELAKGVEAVKPKKTIELYSPEFYAACTIGGIAGK